MEPTAWDPGDELATLAADPEMMGMFVAEALDHLGTIESVLLQLEGAPGNAKLLNDVFRPFHTVKGNAGALGVTSVQELAHCVENLLDLASRMKSKRNEQLLAGKMLGLLFFDRSLRTRVSFEVAMVQLGGHCINISADRELYDLEPQERAVMDGTAEEHVKDAARTLSRYVDALGIRQVNREIAAPRERQELLLRSYARHASVPGPAVRLHCFRH